MRYIITFNYNPYKSIPKGSDFYDWNEYENLPFTISVHYSAQRQVHVLIESKEQPPRFEKKYLSLEKWDEPIRILNRHYVVRLRSRDLNATNDIEEHVNFQIIKFSGKILSIDS